MVLSSITSSNYRYFQLTIGNHDIYIDIYIVYMYITQAAWPGEKSLSHQPGGEIHRTDHRLERHGLRVATVFFVLQRLDLLGFDGI